MIKTRPARLAHRAALGAVDDFAAAWISEGFNAWIRSGCSIPLQRCLGLPTNPDHARKAIRDVWLAEAGKLIEAGSSWRRAKRLKEYVERFERREWVSWKKARIHPTYATELEGLMFFALKSGATLPGTVRQYQRILDGHNSPDECH